MPYDSRSIANEFIKLNDNRVFNQMWLQKMVYLADGWSLAINKESLTDTRIEAWDSGPVYRTIWNHLRDWGVDVKTNLLKRNDGKPFGETLLDSERAVIQHVWKRYGQYSAKELSSMTHQDGTPWNSAYFEHGLNSNLDEREIKKYFIQLAIAGRK